MIKRVIGKAKRLAAPFITTNKKGKLENISIPFDNYDRIVVMETTFGWDSIMKQTPQQLALHFDRDTLVLYHSAKEEYKNAEKYIRIKENLYVLNLDLYRKFIIKKVSQYSEKYLAVFSTDPLSMEIVATYADFGFKIIFEYVDDLNPALCSGPVFGKLKKKFDYMLQTKAHTVCTATRLYESVKDKVPSILVTNGCDYEHFKAQDYPLPEDMKPLKGKRIVGYYGALASWMDYELLKKLSEDGSFEIVLLGVSYDGTLEKSGIAALEHIYCLGKKSYEELPHYAANFDVCIIPFLCNEITMATSPVKLFEYMAAEKPIVTTNLPECKKYKSVITAEDHLEFLSAVKDCLENTGDEKRALLRSEALENTWDMKCCTILDFMKGGPCHD